MHDCVSCVAYSPIANPWHIHNKDTGYSAVIVRHDPVDKTLPRLDISLVHHVCLDPCFMHDVSMCPFIIWCIYNKMPTAHNWDYLYFICRGYFCYLYILYVYIFLRLCFNLLQSYFTTASKHRVNQVINGSDNGPLARYVKLRVAHAPGMLGTFSPPPRVSDPDMHHGTCCDH